jgi:hypothetical protein
LALYLPRVRSSEVLGITRDDLAAHIQQALRGGTVHGKLKQLSFVCVEHGKD